MAERWNPDITTDEYDERWRRLADSGANPHGEADLLGRYRPASVLDGGCGTGRVAIELARRGVDVVGVDADDVMLAAARRKAPELSWITADLATVALGRTFAVVALPGNVMIFVEPVDRGRVVHRLAAHLDVGGLLVAGFQLGRGLELTEYDELAGGAGFALVERFATWGADPYAGGDYAVSVHRLAARSGRTTVHDLLAAAAADGPARLTPTALAALLAGPAPGGAAPLVVDTRTPGDIGATGWIAGSVHAPRTVTEWRADPASGGHHPAFDRFDRRVVVVCNQGYSSVLTAATLRRLGYLAATDLAGGIEAWRLAGLPLVAPADADLELAPRHGRG